MKNPLRSMKLWQKFSAIGLIATVMCAVPLVQLMHYKSGEIAVAEAEDAGIDPVRTALQLQHALQIHRGLTNLVLRGDAAPDADRKARATEVSQHHAKLVGQMEALRQSEADARAFAASALLQPVAVDPLPAPARAASPAGGSDPSNPQQ